MRDRWPSHKTLMTRTVMKWPTGPGENDAQPTCAICVSMTAIRPHTKANKKWLYGPVKMGEPHHSSENNRPCNWGQSAWIEIRFGRQQREPLNWPEYHQTTGRWVKPKAQWNIYKATIRIRATRKKEREKDMQEEGGIKKEQKFFSVWHNYKENA